MSMMKQVGLISVAATLGVVGVLAYKGVLPGGLVSDAAAKTATSESISNAVAGGAKSTKVFVVVNGQPVTYGLADQFVVAQSQRNGKPVSEAHAKEEMISRALLEQEARRLNLDQQQSVRDAVAYRTQSALIDALVQEKILSTKPADAALRADYAAIVKELGAKQYKISSISFPSKKDAEAALASVTAKPATFASLLKEKAGFEGRWTTLAEVGKASRAALEKGVDSMFVVEEGERVVLVKVEDTRPVTIDSFETMRPVLVSRDYERRIGEYLKGLRDKAKVE